MIIWFSWSRDIIIATNARGLDSSGASNRQTYFFSGSGET